MSRWGQLWTQLRLARGGVSLARTFKLRAQDFMHRLCDSTAVARWLRATRRQQCARALQCARAAFDSPRRRALMLSVTGVYHSAGSEKETTEEDSQERPDYVTDEELQELVTDLERAEELSRATLYCASCSLRLVIDTRHRGVEYCTCRKGKPTFTESEDGWMPYMETDDVIIWRKEYKKGQGLYAYKVYGRYTEVCATDFAAVQTDCAYRRAWDGAVAALSTVERAHRGDDHQCVIHWEVMWPRLFANRDYVYVRRHKEFTIEEKRNQNLKYSPVDTTADMEEPSENDLTHRYGSPSRAKRRNTVHARENMQAPDDRVIVIVSKSCEHPKCPETKNAIRVTEYWSHMVIRSVKGVENPGMAFVLTYYDEPGVGGMPGGVAAWATGRVAPDYLARMRAAAAHYRTAPHHPQEETYEGVSAANKKSSRDGEEESRDVREEDMESARRGPEMVGWTPAAPEAAGAPAAEERNADQPPKAADEESCDVEDDPRGWWRYLHPFYYFA